MASPEAYQSAQSYPVSARPVGGAVQTPQYPQQSDADGRYHPAPAGASGRERERHRRSSRHRRRRSSPERRRRSSPGRHRSDRSSPNSRSHHSHSRSRRSHHSHSRSRRSRHSSPARSSPHRSHDRSRVVGSAEVGAPGVYPAGSMAYPARSGPGTGRYAYGVTPPPATLSAYDPHDRAPEDTRTAGQRGAPAMDRFFASGACIVRGTLSVNGVNYSTYEAHMKMFPQHCDHFLDGLRDDIVCEVGNGLRRGDILFRVFPGAVRSLVLKYNEGAPKSPHSLTPADSWRQEDPKLLDADWNMKVDYAVRARNVQRQQRIGTALYHALGSEQGLQSRQTKAEYVKWLDPDHGQDRAISIRRPEQPLQGPAKASTALWDFALAAPPATRAISPVRNVPLGGAAKWSHTAQPASSAPAPARVGSPPRPAAEVPHTGAPGLSAMGRDVVEAAAAGGGAVFEPAEMDGRKGIAVFIPEDAFTPPTGAASRP